MEFGFQCKEMVCDEATKKQKKAKMGLQDRTEVILKRKKKKDLGVVIQDTLSPQQHISQQFGTTYKVLNKIRVVFHYLDKDMMRNILSSTNQDLNIRLLSLEPLFQINDNNNSCSILMCLLERLNLTSNFIFFFCPTAVIPIQVIKQDNKCWHMVEVLGHPI